MRRRWRLSGDVDWVHAVVAVWAIWFLSGIFVLCVWGFLGASNATVNLIGVVTGAGMVGLPLLVAIRAATAHVRRHGWPIRREWESRGTASRYDSGYAFPSRRLVRRLRSIRTVGDRERGGGGLFGRAGDGRRPDRLSRPDGDADRPDRAGRIDRYAGREHGGCSCGDHGGARRDREHGDGAAWVGTRPVAAYGGSDGMILEGVTVSVNFADYLAETLPLNLRQFDDMVVVTAPEDVETQRIARYYGARLVLTDKFRTRWAAHRHAARRRRANSRRVRPRRRRVRQSPRGHGGNGRIAARRPRYGTVRVAARAGHLSSPPCRLGVRGMTGQGGAYDPLCQLPRGHGRRSGRGLRRLAGLSRRSAFSGGAPEGVGR